MKKVICIIQLLLPLVLFSQKNNSEISLMGFNSNETFIIYSNDFYGERSSPITLTVTKSKELSLEYPTLFYKSDISSIPFIVLPGEKLLIKKDKDAFTAEIATDVIRNNELRFFKELVAKLGPVYGIKAVDNILIPYQYLTSDQKANYQKNKLSFKPLPNSMRERDSILYDLYLKRIRFVKSFCLEHPISNFFKNYISSYFFYAYLNNSMTGFLSSSIHEEIPPILKENIKRAVFNSKNDSLLFIDYYRYFIYNYNKFLTKEYFSEQINYKALLESSFVNYKGETEDYLSYIIVKNALRKNYNSTEILLKIFFDKCKNEKYLELIRAEKRLWNLANFDNNSDEFLSQELKTKNLLDIIKKTNAKLVFIDFWASWCIPCLEEMQYSKKLQNEFHGNNGIRFIFISLDNSINVWKKTSNNYKDIMNADNGYLLLKGFGSEFAKKYIIFSIPRYMLINSKGEIIVFDAPRPSEEKLKELIRSKLNE